MCIRDRVKHIAEAHGGYLTVDSVSGKGSTFTLTLPVCAIKEEEEGGDDSAAGKEVG